MDTTSDTNLHFLGLAVSGGLLKRRQRISFGNCANWNTVLVTLFSVSDCSVVVPNVIFPRFTFVGIYRQTTATV